MQMLKPKPLIRQASDVGSWEGNDDESRTSRWSSSEWAWDPTRVTRALASSGFHLR